MKKLKFEESIIETEETKICSKCKEMEHIKQLTSNHLLDKGIKYFISIVMTYVIGHRGTLPRV